MGGFTKAVVTALAGLALAAPLAHASILGINGVAAHSDGPTVEAQPADGVSDRSAKLHARVKTNDEDTFYRFELGTTTGYGTATSWGHLNRDDKKVDVAATVSGLAPGTTYHFRAVAWNDEGTGRGPDGTFTTAAAPAPGSTPGTPGSAPGPVDGGPAPGPTASEPTPEPAMGQTMVAGATAGTVLVRENGSSNWVTLSGTDVMPLGSVIDARDGAVSLVTARAGGVTQAATFRGGMFQVRQSRGGHGMTDIFLRGDSFASCRRAHGARVASAAAKRKVRRLWSKDNHGRYRTHGRNSVATVRGTSWYTEERCDGTVTRVTSGKVLVRDRHTGRHRVLSRGQTFLARARR